MSRHFVLALLWVISVFILGAPSSFAASVEEQCIAAGTVAPLEVRGYTFNHHPERKHEARANEAFFSPFEIETRVVAVLPRLLPSCADRYRQLFSTRLQFKATKARRSWHSMGHWNPTRLLRRAYDGEPAVHSLFAEVQASGESLALRQGCAVESRMQLLTQILDEKTDAIVAKRMSSYDIPVDGWYQARCLGKVSITSLPRLKSCGRRANGAFPGSPRMVSWKVRARRTACGKALRVAQAALEAPSFSEGLLSPALVEGWRCYFAHVSAVDCTQGKRRVFLVPRGSQAHRCKVQSTMVVEMNVLGVACDAAKGLAAVVAEDPRAALRVAHEVEGRSWSCAAHRALEYDDRMTNTYHCFADGLLVFFQLADSPERQSPEIPTQIPPQVKLPVVAGPIITHLGRSKSHPPEV